MRTLPQPLQDEIKVEYNRLGHLVEIVMSAANPALNYYYTDVESDVVWDSSQGYGTRTYITRGIVFDKAQYSLMPKLDSLSFEIDNVQLEISALVMANELRGKQCNIYGAAFGHSTHATSKNPFAVVGATPLFIGQISRIEGTHKKARFEVLNHFQKWNMPTPRRRHITTCGWTFKDADTCAYGGAETACDHSWTRCTALSNTANYGGFRFLDSLQDKEVRWGR